jgi:ABC-type phosphate transport system substrate-binding protein
MTSVLASIALLLATATTTPSQSIAFIVSAKGHTRPRSSAEVRRIFLGQISRWEDGHRIVLIVRPTASPAGRIFLERLIRMSEIDYAHYWIGAVFRGEAASAPRVVDSRESTIKAVAENPDAVGFVLAGEVPESVVVLEVR